MSDTRSEGLSMTIELKPEQERIIREEIRNGHFHSAEEVVDHALAALREKNSSLKPGPKKPRKNLAQFLMESPLAGSGLDLERDKARQLLILSRGVLFAAFETVSL